MSVLVCAVHQVYFFGNKVYTSIALIECIIRQKIGVHVHIVQSFVFHPRVDTSIDCRDSKCIRTNDFGSTIRTVLSQ